MGKTRRFKRKHTWTNKKPTREGRYWYRADDDVHRDGAVLYVFDPQCKGDFKAWDWHEGTLMLCTIVEYEGEWWGGPMEVPPK
jgi:hypothetical protein